MDLRGARDAEHILHAFAAQQLDQGTACRSFWLMVTALPLGFLRAAAPPSPAAWRRPSTRMPERGRGVQMRPEGHLLAARLRDTGGATDRPYPSGRHAIRREGGDRCPRQTPRSPSWWTTTPSTQPAHPAAAPAGLASEHGLSFWIESDGKHILFDTGQGPSLRTNVPSLGIDLARPTSLVLSHGHYDHTGGLDYVLGMAPRARVYCHPGGGSDSLLAYATARPGPSASPARPRKALKRLPAERLRWVLGPIDADRAASG